MEIKEIQNKEEINSFLLNQKHAQFVQSWEWGEFQKSFGRKVVRLGFYEHGNLIFALNLIKNQFPLGLNYFYSPRIGIKHLSEDQLNSVFSEIAESTKKEKVTFFRFDPRSKLPATRFQYPLKKTIHVQPPKTLILDLGKSEDELLSGMHQKTRYNVRLARRKGVKVRETGESEFSKWWEIMEETKNRDQFRLHKKRYYEKMLSIDFIKLLVAEYDGKIIAGNIISLFGDMVTYVHGGSSNQYRNVMAPYLLQWEAIKQAKEKGVDYYDLNGIDEKMWPGVTRFKKGFGGEEINYPGTFDLVFNKNKYQLYKILRKIRRLI